MKLKIYMMMSDVLEDTDEINEIMGRSYGVPEELDENDLMDELNSLEDELAEEETEETPAYLVNAATASKQAALANQTSSANKTQKTIRSRN